MAKMVIKMISETEAQVTKAFAKNAVIFGTEEYKLWREYRKDFPNAKMVTKTSLPFFAFLCRYFRQSFFAFRTKMLVIENENRSCQDSQPLHIAKIVVKIAIPEKGAPC